MPAPRTTVSSAPVDNFFCGQLLLRAIVDRVHRHLSRAQRGREFTFDHVSEGLVVGCRRDDKELFVIRVPEQPGTEEILPAADPRIGERQALAYAAYLDNAREDVDAGAPTAASTYVPVDMALRI